MHMTSGEIAISSGLLVVFLIGLIFLTFFTKSAKLRNDSMEEYALGSRSFNYFVVLCTLIGIFLPASMYIGWYSWTMFEGIVAQYIVVYGIAAFFTMYLFTQKIWIWGKSFGLLTQPDFIDLRFQSKPLTYLSAVSGFLIEAPWTIMEIASIGWLVSAVTGGMISRQIGILVIGGIVLAYVLRGGMRSVAVTEILKGLLVIAICIVGSVVIIYKLFGGFGPMYSNLVAAFPENMTFNYGGHYSYAYWTSIILTGTLGGFAWQSMFARVYTARSVREVKKSASGGAVLAVLVSALLLAVATGAILIPGAAEAGEMAFFFITKTAFGPVFMGLAGILVLAAAMGFIGVIMSAHGVIISENLIRPFTKNMNEEKRRKTSRLSTLVYGVICMLIAMVDLPNLAIIAITIYEGIIQFLPLLLFGIFWHRANKWSVGIGLGVGLVIAIGLAIHPMPLFGDWTPGIIGLIVNIAINIILGFVCSKDDYVDTLFNVIRTYKENSRGEQVVTEESIAAMALAEQFKLN